jgi:hypothetical protein
MLRPASSQLSPSASARNRALLTIGTTAKSKLSKVLPGGRWAACAPYRARTKGKDAAMRRVHHSWRTIDA